MSVRPGDLFIREGECAPLRFDFRPAEPLDRLHGRPTVFVHVLDGRQHVVGDFDHPLPLPWAPGTPQEYELPICPSAAEHRIPPGTYRVTAGLYDDSWGYRWILLAEAGNARRREYLVATLTVAPGSR
jgi:hypothetical protein